MKLLLATGLLVATVSIAASLLDLTAVVTAFSSLSVHTIFVILILGSVNWVLRGLRTWLLFEQVPLLEALGMSFVHNTANNLAPMRLGELALPLLARWLGNVEFSVGLTSLLWIRLLDFISLVSISLCVFLLPSVGSIMLAFIAALIFLTPLLIAVLVPKTQGLRLPKILEQARSQLIFESQNGQRLHRIWRLTILAWLAKILGMAILLATLSGIAVTDVISTILGAELSSILPIHGLAGAGSYEAGGIIGSTFVGLSPILALEMTIQLHIYVLSLTVVFGILGVLLLLKRTLHG
ncbi:MAG: lysylphosphatidylglycerol synthase domain-containing protein [Pseudomonadota bacterium]|nr:lysylphosphatidylglycerol synthase domain-containing protein [Pseudomonadota bacterium]